jgi:putative NIF3 family GTP cyclohydrolase 1 type 2
LFLTGEMGHHQALDLCDRANAYVILTEHSNCERGYLKDSYVARLKAELSTGDESEPVEILFSQIDSDPLQIA